MSKTVDFLHEAKIFYLATVDGNQAQIRPINSVIAFQGKIYFETSSRKAMYRQMLKNPNVAVCGMAGAKWIRITGKAVMDERDEAKQMIPTLKNVYSYEELVPYYLINMQSVIHVSGGDSIELQD